MKWLFWVSGTVLVLLAVPAAVFFGLHLASGEPVPLRRARALWHWVIVVALGTFDIAIFTKVVQGIMLFW